MTRGGLNVTRQTFSNEKTDYKVVNYKELLKRGTKHLWHAYCLLVDGKAVVIMKRKNINNLLWVVFALLFIAGCGPSGAIGTDATITPTGFAVDLLCNGAACGEDVAADAIIGVKITPAVEASTFTTVLSCDGADYPLTLAGQEAVEDSMLFSFTHATIPQVRPCTVAVSFVDAVKSLYGDPETPATVDFTIACDPAGSDDFSYAPTLEKCWKAALISSGAKQQAGMGQVGGKAIGATSPIVGNSFDDLRAAGVTAEIKDGALQITTATGTDLTTMFVMIYKSFDGPDMPEITAQLADDGFDLRPMLDLNNRLVYYANEMYAVVTADNASLADTCTFNMSVKGLPGNLTMGGGGGGMGQPVEPPAYFGENDWPGIKFISVQQSVQQAMMNNSSLTEGGCGFETTDNAEALMTKINARTNAVRQSIPVDCTYETASIWTAGEYGGVEARGYAYGSGMAMQDHVWQDKFGQYSTVGSDFFETAAGTVVGFMYTSQFDSTKFPVVKGEAPPPEFVPFKLIVDDVQIKGPVANYE